MTRERSSRRAFVRASARALAIGLASGSAAVSGGCAAPPPLPPKPAPVPPLATSNLAELLPEPGLVWALRARPRTIAQIPWLIPAIAAFAPEARLDAFLATTGVDLRQVTEAWFATYDLGRGESSIQVFRHGADPALIERRFRERLSSNVERIADRDDLVRLGGGIGPERHVMTLLGRDLVIFERGATARRGASALLSARARGELRDVTSIERSESLGPLLRRFGDAPLIALSPGPLDSALGSKPAGGGERSELGDLLAVSTGAGVGVRPTAREGIGIAVAVGGAFGDRAAQASEVLERSWSSLRKSELGRMLALDRDKGPALPTHAADIAALAVELDATGLAEGLRDLTELDLRRLIE